MSLIQRLRQSFKTKLLLLYASLWLLFSLITGIVIYRMIVTTLETKMGNQLLAAGRLVAQSISPQLPPYLQPDVLNTSPTVRHFSKQLKALLKAGVFENILILNSHGIVLKDSTGEAIEGFKSDVLNDQTLTQLRHGHAICLPIHRGSFGLLHQSAFIPLKIHHWILQVDANPRYLDSLRQFRNIYFLFGIIGLIIITFLNTFIAQTVLKPVEEITHLAHSIAAGNYPPSIKTTRIDELGTLIHSLDIMSARIQNRESELERLAQDLKEIAAGIAHEVRNPLSVIRGQAEWIEKKIETLPDLAMAAHKIQNQVQALNSLVTQFLEYSRPLQLQLKLVNLNELMLNLKETLLQLSQKQNVAIITAIEPCAPLLVDTTLVSSGLLNLGINALQAMPTGGTLTLRLQSENSQAILSVEDTGPGISNAIRPNLFKPFFSTKSSGTGLGLAFVDKVIRAHKGIIHVLNRPEGGAIFQLIFSYQKDLSK